MADDIWPQLVFDATADMVPELEDMLFAAGALSIILADNQNQPVLEPAPGEVRLWQSLRVTGLFAREDSAQAILKRCSDVCEGPLPQHRFENLPDEEWEKSWMAHFKAMQFGRHLWVVPSHVEEPQSSALSIRLDPGLAFGSGTHPTTALCLEWLSNQIDVANIEASQLLQGKTVIDYGCGSGILAIAAARLGASRVLAVDIDPQALQATEDNALQNAVGDVIETLNPEQLKAKYPVPEADLLLANILFNPLLMLADEFSCLLAPNGSLVVSGILADQVDALMLRYTKWFISETTRSVDGWSLLQCRCVKRASVVSEATAAP